MIKHSLEKLVVILFAFVILLFSIFPFLFMILSSLKTQQEIYTLPLWQFPKVFQFNNYITVLTGNFFIYLRNSLIVVSVSVVIILLLSAMVSFSLVRVGFKGSSSVLALIIAGMAIPVYVTLIPVYLMTFKLGMIDHIWALIGPYVAFNIPMSIFILSDYMSSVPIDLEEAARIDGCSYMNVFWKIYLPLSKPGLIALAIFNSVSLWGEFVFALILTQSINARTLPLGIWDFMGAHAADVPLMMAFLTLSALPLIIAYFFGQDKLISGMLSGALK